MKLRALAKQHEANQGFPVYIHRLKARRNETTMKRRFAGDDEELREADRT